MPARARTRPGSGIEQAATYVAGPHGALFCSIVAPEAGALANIVICPPLLADFAFSYRRELVLATELARLGAAVWRFHYAGTGYSEGDPSESTFAGMVADAGAVVGAAAAACGAPLALVGTRCGAFVAAAAAGGAAIPVALWEPLEDGADYLREGFRARIIVDGGQLGRPPVTSAQLLGEIHTTGATELVGYTLHRPLYESLLELRLTSCVSAATPRVLLIRSQPVDGAASTDHLSAALTGKGIAVTAATLGVPESWWFHRMQQLPAGEMGRRLAEMIAPWLKTSTAAEVTVPASAGARQPAYISSGDGNVFGLLTSPPAAANGLTAVILWGGAGIPSFGRNQVAAKLAECLTDRGFHVLQLDYPGCGESPGPTQTEPIDEASKLALFESVRSAYRWLAAQGLGQVVAIGSCQGAVAALYTAEDIPSPVGLALLAAPVREGDEICVPGAPGGADEGAVSPRYLDAMSRAVDAGMPILLLYGSDDEVFPDFDRARTGELGQLLCRAGKRATLRLTDERIHGYLTVSGQEAGSDAVVEWLDAILPAATPAGLPAIAAATAATSNPVPGLVRAHIAASRSESMMPPDFEDDTSLIDAGMLDSLAVFKMVAFLEARFGIEIPDEQLVWDNFETVAAVARLVESKLPAAGIKAEAASL
jgi:acyl carrier protein/alpha-beta hydrolase superfamily lysophospholipase